jgi:hypothetical protein
VRIEWVDDTSANVLYDPPQAAEEALVALTDTTHLDAAAENVPSLQLRPAKPFSSHPESNLFVRQSTNADAKKKGAHEASRYYLLNPDQDPWERKKHTEPRRPQRGRRNSNENGDYNRRRFDDNEHKRRRNDQSAGFDVNMYDEDGPAVRDERRKRARFGTKKGEDLFSSRSTHSVDGRLRNRSSSPGRDGDGTMGFDSDGDYRQRSRIARRRSPSPNRTAPKNTGKELFPSGTGGSSLADAAPSNNAVRELFPVKSSSGSTLRSSLELFPNKRQSFSNHRRSYAFDASTGEGAEFFATSLTPPPARERSLADRITGRPATASDNVRIKGLAEERGISIRGMGGMSIRGTAGSADKELFPLKAGNNVGKELFGDKLSGSRRKAQDTFS